MTRRNTRNWIAAFIASPAVFALSACQTEPEMIEETPVEDSTVVDGTAPGVGAGNPNGDAEPSTAIPGDDVYGPKSMDEPEPPSGAEATNDIEVD